MKAAIFLLAVILLANQTLALQCTRQQMMDPNDQCYWAVNGNSQTSAPGLNLPGLDMLLYILAILGIIYYGQKLYYANKWRWQRHRRKK